jgi:hypothetical protein
MDRRQGSDDVSIVEVDFDAAELRELRDLPQDDRGNGPR